MNIMLNNGENLYYVKREGGDQVVLLLHGNMTSSVQWGLLLEQMDPAFTMYAVDLRGYGKSTYHKPIDSIRDFSEDIKQFVDQLALEKFVLMGWSNGGGVAMQFAASYPEHIHKMILLSSMSTRGYPALNTNGEKINSKDQIAVEPGLSVMFEAQRTKNTDFFKAAMDQVLYSANKPMEERYQKYVISATQQRNMLEAAYVANKFNISNVSNGLVDGTGEVNHITAPVLVIWGENDLITSEGMTLEIIEDFKQAGIEYIYTPVKAGHALLIDNIAAVLEETYTFLSMK